MSYNRSCCCDCICGSSTSCFFCETGTPKRYYVSIVEPLSLSSGCVNGSEYTGILTPSGATLEGSECYWESTVETTASNNIKLWDTALCGGSSSDATSKFRWKTLKVENYLYVYCIDQNGGTFFGIPQNYKIVFYTKLTTNICSRTIDIDNELEAADSGSIITIPDGALGANTNYTVMGYGGSVRLRPCSCSECLDDGPYSGCSYINGCNNATQYRICVNNDIPELNTTDAILLRRTATSGLSTTYEYLLSNIRKYVLTTTADGPGLCDSPNNSDSVSIDAYVWTSGSWSLYRTLTHLANSRDNCFGSINPSGSIVYRYWADSRWAFSRVRAYPDSITINNYCCHQDNGFDPCFGFKYDSGSLDSEYELRHGAGGFGLGAGCQYTKQTNVVTKVWENSSVGECSYAQQCWSSGTVTSTNQTNSIVAHLDTDCATSHYDYDGRWRVAILIGGYNNISRVFYGETTGVDIENGQGKGTWVISNDITTDCTEYPTLENHYDIGKDGTITLVVD